MCGHLCARKCQEQVKPRAWWFNWKRDVNLFVRCCPKCQSYHRGRAPKQGLLNPQIVGEVASRWSVDLCGDFPPSQGHRYILTAVDCFSKYAIAVPIRDKTAKTVARVLVEKLLLTHSLPTEILSDRGSEFLNELQNELFRSFGIHRLRTSARKASTNGQVERLHRTLNSILAKLVNASHSDWARLVPYAAMSYSATVHNATGLSPFFVMFGRNPRWNIDLLLAEHEANLTTVPEYTAQLIDCMRTAHNAVREKLNHQAQYMSQWYNAGVRPAEFNVGDTVRVFNDSTAIGLCPKWLHFYRDIATVVKRFNDVSYLLTCRFRSAIPAVHHRTDHITLASKPQKIQK